jgi:hypothetical protein
MGLKRNVGARGEESEDTEREREMDDVCVDRMKRGIFDGTQEECGSSR